MFYNPNLLALVRAEPFQAFFNKLVLDVRERLVARNFDHKLT